MNFGNLYQKKFFHKVFEKILVEISINKKSKKTK